MKRLLVLFSCASIIPVIAAGCSSSSSNGGDTTDAGSDGATTGDSATDSSVINDPQNCVAPGTTNNELGMGGYCSPGGHQCDTAGPSGAARLCSADYGAPAHAWFCTYPCSVVTDCGSGEACIGDAQGTGCVPNACTYLESTVDSGLDGSTDGGSD
jgi:hypothetical protein